MSISLTSQGSAAVSLLRPYQWVKNLFVAAPLLFTPDLLNGHNALVVLGGVVCFCALSSGVYIINDIGDREADKKHPHKRLRPLAAGRISVAFALVLAASCIGAGLVGAFSLNTDFAWIAALYTASSIAYTLGLKRFSIVDVLMVGLGYVLRVLSGGAILALTLSSWIVVMTGLLAVFITLAKRRDDLLCGLGPDHRPSLSGYSLPFLDTAISVILAAILISYLIYTNAEDVRLRFGTDNLHYTSPFVLAGVLRYLQISLIEKRSGDPTRIVLTDPFLLASILGWYVSFVWVIYP